jgi:hypothetical protein
MCYRSGRIAGMVSRSGISHRVSEIAAEKLCGLRDFSAFLRFRTDQARPKWQVLGPKIGASAGAFACDFWTDRKGIYGGRLSSAHSICGKKAARLAA